MKLRNALEKYVRAHLGNNEDIIHVSVTTSAITILDFAFVIDDVKDGLLK